MSAGAVLTLRRRFLQVGARRVHYLRAGSGPPAVLVHSSPANAWLVRPELERVAQAFTTFAFDTPGFGLSDPLPGERLTMVDLADALAETLAAIGMPPCPFYGTHTGAAIALELAARHPERVTGLVLDGVPAFTEAEQAALFGDYFRTLPVSDLGGQYAQAWTRFRDQATWFPWSHRAPGRLNAYDLSPPESTHAWVSMYFQAADTYAPAYRAALSYGQGALAAAKAVLAPVVYTATDTDMLHPHLERLKPLLAGQRTVGIGRSSTAKYDLIAESFARFGASGAPPADPAALAGPGVDRRFLDRADGGQLHLRTAGDEAAPLLLLLHDAPGSAAQLEPLITALATRRRVLAPDLPGAGESDRLATLRPAMADYVATIIALMDACDVPRAEVVGVGFGASVAVELAHRAPERVAALALEGLLLPTSEARAELAARYAPAIGIEPDGAHWYRTWLMLRDSQVWWPWYDRREARLRRVEADFDGARLHAWTLDVMRARETYAALIAAALEHDAAAALARTRAPLARLEGLSSLCAYDDRLAELAPDAARVDARQGPERLAKELFALDGWSDR